MAEIVLDCPWEAESMGIGDLLMSQHRWGRTRCRRFLAAIPMVETKTIGSMTDRQRRALAARLSGEDQESEAWVGYAAHAVGSGSRVASAGGGA